MSCQQRIYVGIASLCHVFSKCDSVLENDKDAGFLGCGVLLLTEIKIGKRAIFLENSVQDGRRNEVQPICEPQKKRMKRTWLTKNN